MISYGKQSIDRNDVKAVKEVLRSDWLTQGPYIKKFENKLSNYFGAKYCCALSNGTAALHLTGLALGWQENDIILTTPITFLATINSIEYSNATPDFVDIDPETYNLDVNKVEDRIKFYLRKGKSIKAIIGVDFAGHPCDWEGLRFLADKYEIQLINDNCHALGAKLKGDSHYACHYADVVTQSYHPVKHITTGEGGSVLTNSSETYKKVKLLSSHGMEKDSENKNFPPWYYEMINLGFNYRITDFQCALGINQLKKLDEFVSKRKKRASLYNKKFDSHQFFRTPKELKNYGHAYHLYPMLINFDQTGYDKSLFFSEMKKVGFSLQVHYIPVYTQPYYKKKYGFSEDYCPNALKFYHEEVSFPIFPDLSRRDQLIFIDKVKSYFKDK